jgi:serine/threonine protein kinase
LIEGRNLAEVVRDLRERNGSGLPPREAAELARQAAEALDYAHRHDVLHLNVVAGVASAT